MVRLGRRARVLARVRRRIAGATAAAVFDDGAVAIGDRMQIGGALVTARRIGLRIVIVSSVSRSWTACSESNYCEQQR